MVSFLCMADSYVFHTYARAFRPRGQERPDMSGRWNGRSPAARQKWPPFGEGGRDVPGPERYPSALTGTAARLRVGNSSETSELDGGAPSQGSPPTQVSPSPRRGIARTGPGFPPRRRPSVSGAYAWISFTTWAVSNASARLFCRAGS